MSDNSYSSLFDGEFSALEAVQNYNQEQTNDDLDFTSFTESSFENINNTQTTISSAEDTNTISDAYFSAEDMTMIPATLSSTEDTNATSSAYSSAEDINTTSPTQSSVEDMNVKSQTSSSEEDINSTPPEPIQAPSPAKNKRKRSDQSSGKASKKSKGEPKPKKERPSEQYATGFLSNGQWMRNAKFACVVCRRGHRANLCKDWKSGTPVQLVTSAGRPTKGEVKIDTVCNCVQERCRCRHPSYLLEEVEINGVKNLRIGASVFSDGKGKIVRCDAPCSTGFGGSFPGM